MRYMLLICGDDEAHKATEADGSFLASCHAWADEMQQRRVLVTIGGLHSPSGFGLVECADLDEALEVTSKHPAAKYGTIEIRPLPET